MANRFEDRRSVSVEEAAEAARAAGAKSGDPLAELAKLIGQTDPFANFGRANPTHPLRRDPPSRAIDSEQSDRRDADEYFDREIFDEAPSQPPAWIQHRSESLAAAEHADDADFINRPHPLHRYGGQHEDEGRGDAAYAEGAYPETYYAQDAALPGQGYPNDPYVYTDDYSDQPGAARERSRRGLLTVAAVLGLAVIGTGGAFAYRTYVSSPRSGDVPVIKADPTPIKVVPPTTADAANKLIQDRLGTPGTETMVSREEQPVDVRDPSKAGARVPASTFAAKAPSAGVVPTSPGAAATGAEEPKRVRTLTVKGDESDKAGYAPKPPARTPAAPSTLAPAARAPSTPGPTASLSQPANAPMSINPRAPAPAPAATSGGYVVQVSSQRSEADAQSSYRTLQSKFPSVLGSRSANIKRADLGEKGTYYRAVLGPFSTAEDAAALCGNLKSAGGQCVVQRN